MNRHKHFGHRRDLVSAWNPSALDKLAAPINNGIREAIINEHPRGLSTTNLNTEISTRRPAANDNKKPKDKAVAQTTEEPTEEERVAFIRRVSTMLTPKLKEKWDPQDPLNHLSFLLATSQRELEAELESLPAKSQREVVHAVTRVGGYMAEVFEQHVKAETTKRLKTKEGKVDAELKKQKGITAQMQKMLKEPFDKKDFKFIRGVLHSDRPVADDRRDKAFDLFLKLAPLFAA